MKNQLGKSIIKDICIISLLLLYMQVIYSCYHTKLLVFTRYHKNPLFDGYKQVFYQT